MINAQDIKNGTCIRMDGRLYFCVEFLHVKPGKGNTFMRTKLKGDWLKETGFDVGGLIQVECENGKLIITPREPEMVEYHAPCGQCIMVAEDCKCYGKKGRK